MGFDLRSLDLSDLVRANKQGVNLDTKTAHVDDSEHPLKGVTGSQRNRVLVRFTNDTSGTRTIRCGVFIGG